MAFTCTPCERPCVASNRFEMNSNSAIASRLSRGWPNPVATSCVTCVAEMPKIISTYNKYQGRGYDTLAVAMSYDPPSYVVNYVETRKLPFKVAIDNTGAVAKAWGDVQLTPTTYVVNKRGEIVKQYVGEPDFAALHQLIEKLLAET